MPSPGCAGNGGVGVSLKGFWKVLGFIWLCLFKLATAVGGVVSGSSGPPLALDVVVFCAGAAAV